LKIIHAKLTSWQNGIVLAPPGDGGCGIAAGVALHLDLAALAGHHGLRGVVRDDGRSPHRQLHLGADFVDGGYHHLTGVGARVRLLDVLDLQLTYMIIYSF